MPLPASAFQPAVTIVERSVQLGDETSHAVWFKVLPNSVFERYAMMRGSSDEETQAMAPTWLVAQGVCEPDGSPSMTVDEADRLKRDVLLRLCNRVLDVNGFAPPPKGAAKDAPVPNGSGAREATGSGSPLPLQ
jgi:hypothetical protein